MSTPVRVLQVLGMTALAVTFWMFVPMRVLDSQLPGGDLEGTLADLTAGGVGQRWHSFYVAVLAWGHIPILFLLLLVRAGLTVFGLGPVGLLAGVVARRGQLMSAWVGTLGMVLSAVHTVVLVLALVLAVATG